MNSKISMFFPILLALAIAVGILLGFWFSGNSSGSKIMPRFSGSSKFDQLVGYASKQYVDTINTEPLVEEAIQHFLQELDPHSYYLGKEDLAAANEPLDGKFEGVGVEFRIQNDSLFVVNPIAGGPSEKVGILAGDRIVIIDGEEISGPELNNKKVMSMLKGKGGTKVDVTVVRPRAKKNFDFTIVRGTIPIFSVDVSIRLNDKTGYIKVSRFAQRTYEELLEGLKDINASELDNLILDLRNNGGGYMRTAISIADEFLEPNKMIVYTEGKAQARKNYTSTRAGKLDDINVIVLMNENSASASEIVAGAIQDNDRGTIIGRRSFGKGLVQEPMQFSDGTVVRLTVARYYTPTGRSIQKPYGKDINYEEDYMNRVDNGELYSADSIVFPDSLKYYTPGGKIVYGGGGIMPDVFVSIDTTYASDYFYEVAYAGLLNQFSFEYVDNNRKSLSKDYSNALDFSNSFNINSSVFNEFLAYAEENGVQQDTEGIERAKVELKNRLKANIGRNLWRNEGYYRSFLKSDPVILKTLEFIDNPKIAEK